MDMGASPKNLILQRKGAAFLAARQRGVKWEMDILLNEFAGAGDLSMSMLLISEYLAGELARYVALTPEQICARIAVMAEAKLEEMRHMETPPTEV